MQWGWGEGQLRVVVQFLERGGGVFLASRSSLLRAGFRGRGAGSEICV